MRRARLAVRVNSAVTLRSPQHISICSVDGVAMAILTEPAARAPMPEHRQQYHQEQWDRSERSVLPAAFRLLGRDPPIRIPWHPRQGAAPPSCAQNSVSIPGRFRQEALDQFVDNDTNLRAHLTRMRPKRMNGKAACRDLGKYVDQSALPKVVGNQPS